ncbi:MAG TPA: sigma-E factor regulatory protein RseB domain-containing protein [Armatimonadota bacterium]|jgi:negative regulator of sigma E activity
MRAVLLSLMLLSSSVGALPAAIEDGARLLTRAYAQERKVSSLSAVTAHTSGGATAATTTLRLTRSAGKQRMEYTSGALKGRVLVDDGKSVFWLDPARRTADLAASRKKPESLSLLLRNYRPRRLGAATVAGRKAVILRVEPRTPPGPSRTLWVDEASGLIVKTDSFNSGGQLLSSTATTSLKLLPPQPGSLFRVPSGFRVSTGAPEAPPSMPRDRLEAAVGFSLALPHYLPPGFQLDGMSLATTGSGRPAAQLRYSDGMNSLSLFEHTRGPGGGRGAGWGRGGGMGFGGGRGWRGARGQGQAEDTQCLLLAGGAGRSLRVWLPGRSYLLVGDLPEATLRRIADSIR